MADGDVVFDRRAPIDASAGEYIDIFAVEDSSYPGGYFYRFQYYAADGEEILRYDASRTPRHGAGCHHRHRGPDPTDVQFDSLDTHINRFITEVYEIHDQRH
jgi:hypothetical protein